MRVVIDIPEEYCNAIKAIPDIQCTADMLIIKNGTPLPKVHGRLIDADALKNKIMYKDDVAYETWDELYDSVLEEIDNAPTIIEGSDSE